MLKKIVSDASREKRGGETEGWDYYYLSLDRMLQDKEKEKYMQFISFGGNAYGYKKSEFDRLDELIVVCGGSGAGKDTAMKHLYDEQSPAVFPKEKRIGFLFSVPETLPLFSEYAKKHNIPATFILLSVSEDERFRRIASQYINEYFLTKAGISFSRSEQEGSGVFKAVDLDTFTVNDEVLRSALLACFDEAYSVNLFFGVREQIEKAIGRIARDREQPFEQEVKKISGKIKHKVRTIHISNGDSVAHTANLVKKSILLSREDANRKRVGVGRKLS